MSDLEKFLHNEDIFVPHLIKVAIAHYQFEAIHPFLDGNGRIGRLLITLYLISNGLLKKPSLYLSDYMEKNKNEYYRHLTNVRINNNLTDWVKFFLEVVISTANSGIKTFEEVLRLKSDMDFFIANCGRKAPNAKKLIEFLYQKPIVSVSQIIEPLKITKQTANELIKEFEKKNILSEITHNKRNKYFIFDKYINIFMKD